MRLDLSAAMTAQRWLQMNMAGQANSLTKLATGMRINRAADDPAGMITTEQLESMLKSIEAESRALERMDYMASTADGALTDVSDLLGEAEALAIANANTAGMSDEELAANQMELDAILDTVDRISGSTYFNGTSLLDGTASMTVDDHTLEIDSSSSMSIGETEIDGETYTLADTGSGGALNIENGDVSGALMAIREASSNIATLRGKIGSFSANTINTRVGQLSVTSETVSAVASIIRDTDYSTETATLSMMTTMVEASRFVANAANEQQKSLLNVIV